MIRHCVECHRRYSTPNRAWYDKYILHVCSTNCLHEAVTDRPTFQPTEGVQCFRHSDRSFRSKYEERFYKYLKNAKIRVPVAYEPFIFDLPNGDRYVPDFLVNGSVFFEVKGIWDGRGKSKFKSFVENFSDIPIFVVDLDMLSLLGGKNGTRRAPSRTSKRSV